MNVHPLKPTRLNHPAVWGFLLVLVGILGLMSGCQNNRGVLYWVRQQTPPETLYGTGEAESETLYTARQKAQLRAARAVASQVAELRQRRSNREKLPEEFENPGYFRVDLKGVREVEKEVSREGNLYKVKLRLAVDVAKLRESSR